MLGSTRLAREGDAEAAAALEAVCFPADEAATLEQVRFRIREAGAFFLLGFEAGSGELVAFVNGTLTAHATLTHDSMATHDPDGGTICVHSVAVAPRLRRRGVALSMLRAYERELRGSHAGRVRQALLICKERMQPLYLKAGYALVGPSPVVHGKDQWYEMRLDLL